MATHEFSVDGIAYEVDADLAGETVLLWWGLFDRDLYVEHGERRFGPYAPVGGPIPLHRYRSHQKTKSEERADRIAALAERLGLPRAALEGRPELVGMAAPVRPEPAKPSFRLAITTNRRKSRKNRPGPSKYVAM